MSIKRMTDRDKAIIREAKHSIAELSKHLGFSRESVSLFAKHNNIILPRAAKPARIHHIEIGKTYGQLTVIERSAQEGKTMYLCECSCGNRVIRAPRSLFTTIFPSCGCAMPQVHFSKRHKDGAATAHVIYLNYQHNAARKSLVFDLSENEFFDLTQQPCVYCGAPPANIARRGNSATPFTYNGIDRRDNNIGYTLANSVPCCKYCNVSKGARNVDEFKAWAIRLANQLQESKK